MQASSAGPSSEKPSPPRGPWEPAAQGASASLGRSTWLETASRWLLPAEGGLLAGMVTAAVLVIYTGVFIGPAVGIASGVALLATAFWLGRNAEPVFESPIEIVEDERPEPEPPRRVLEPLLEMAPIPGGRFQMGSEGPSAYPDEKPVHVVRVEPFALSRHTVTRSQYRKLMGAAAAPRQWTEPDDGKLPANHVSWLEAARFCNALSASEGLELSYEDLKGGRLHARPAAIGYRLPTEAEWEYACRAGSKAEYCFGDEVKELGEHAWYFINSGSKELPLDTPHDFGKAFGEWGCRVQEVGRKKPNRWGLHDMHGNVFEWCEDTWHGNYEGAPEDGSAWIDEASGSRVFRGGSFGRTSRVARSACRGRSHPRERGGLVGFRPARSVARD